MYLLFVIRKQFTIKKKVLFEGIGLHSGIPVKMTIYPAEKNLGICFVRTDLKNNPSVNANWSNVVSTNLCTKISNKKGVEISTIEHLMFALYSLGITNVIIKINAPEVPIMDGSSKIFIEKILEIGLTEQDQIIKNICIKKPFKIVDGKKFIEYQPNNKNYLEIDYTLDYKDQFIKKQNFYIQDVQKNFLEIYHCRTFCHQEDLEKIFAMGLAKGGSLDNAIVISGSKILNQNGLRCENEFVKHKILDCIGDIYLSGFFISGKIICNQGGHELTLCLLKTIFENQKNYFIDNLQKFNNNQTLNKISNRSAIVSVV